jgi:2-polyprenyl-6-methoxyphenol hydroxylase-like FAD-dependent oxidoreductase
MSAQDVPVVIVGGSLVGLSTALFLGARGIPSLVVERHPGTAIHPRAALVSQRSVELYRALGLQDEIEAAAANEFVQNGAIVSVEALGGKELEWYFRSINEGVESLSPAPRVFITQIGLEPILRRHSEASGARLAYGAEAVGLEQDDEGVTVHLRAREGGGERSVRARYAVAADGARSPMRELLGIPMRGHGTFSDSITIYFRADVNPLLGDRNLSVIYVFHPRLQGFFRFSLAGDAGFLVVNSTVDEQGVRNTSPGEDMGEERCIEYVRLALGDERIAVEIESVQRWNAMADWAERFQEGRVFLAGDAAHVMPPTGGFGGNCGIHDADNLAWKLAAVLRGEAGPGLLATYDAERRPVGEFTVEQAYTRYVLRLDPALGKENLMPIVGEATVELGYRYHSRAVLPEPAEDGSLWESPHEPTARPGSRAPHLALAQGTGAPSSTLDVAHGGFAVLAGPAGEPWCQAARAVSAQTGIAIECRCIVDAPAFAELYGTGADGAVLLRPDGFVGWRARSAAADAEADLRGALDAILDAGGRTPADVDASIA